MDNTVLPLRSAGGSFYTPSTTLRLVFGKPLATSRGAAEGYTEETGPEYNPNRLEQKNS